jgi:hypothetical protein
MKKLITGAIVAAALAVPATPAFAIHDGTGMPGAVCSNPDSRAVGNNPNPGSPNLGVSNTDAGMAGHNKFAAENTHPPCANAS